MSAKVLIVMGSTSDHPTMKKAEEILKEFGVSFKTKIVSAHRTPELLTDFVKAAKDRGLSVIIAGAGGSAHLAGVTAAHTSLPVLSIPIRRDNHGHEALWSNIMMPPGVPLATMPENGSTNAALFAVRMLALSDPALSQRYDKFRQSQVESGIEVDRQLQDDGWEATLSAPRGR